MTEPGIAFDLWLVGGLAILVLSIPAFVSAWSDRRTPRLAAVLILLGGGMVLFPLTEAPGGYGLADVPEAAIRVIAWIVR